MFRVIPLDRSRFKVIRRYKIIPDEEIIAVLLRGDSAFIEDSAEYPIRRQTIHSATKRIGRIIGKNVKAKRVFIKIETEEGAQLIPGYEIYIEEESTNYPKSP
ncbi:MAG: hypothetical protein OH337_03820 [Candidatus Parvarchaeota archaeon]|nr:hypothetical protein [Candidatus Haiyanarchaeum thermophilum]